MASCTERHARHGDDVQGTRAPASRGHRRLVLQHHEVREGTRRKVPASERVIAAAKRLLEIGGVPDDDPEQMGHRLKAACKAAKIQPYTTRQLRDTYGVTCLRNGMDPATLLVRMGHRGLETTEKLIRALEAERGDDFAPV